MIKIFRIPLPTHLVKFSERELWEGYKPPFPVDERDILGKHIFSILVDLRFHKPTFPDDDADWTYLVISLSDQLAKRSPDLVKLSRVNIFLEACFKRALMIWVTAQLDAGQNKYQAVINFLKHYNILTDDTLDRYYLYVKRRSNLPYRRQKG